MFSSFLHCTDDCFDIILHLMYFIFSINFILFNTGDHYDEHPRASIDSGIW